VKKGWLHLIILLVIALIGLAPVLSVMAASGLASANGCALDEGSVHACMMGGRDYGDLLYGMGVMGWFALATLPLAGITIIVYLIVLLVLYVARKKNKSSPVGSDVTRR
jgi:hypothetical protein